MLFKESSAVAGDALEKRIIGRLARDRLHERWQVSWLAG